MTNSPEIDNILAVYVGASAQAKAEGMEWYAGAHALACSLDPKDPSQAAGVIAALSPMMPWTRNQTLAIQAYANGGLGPVGLKGSVDKANRILAGESADSVLGGDKVRAFWQSIADPGNPNTAAVIDRHAYDIAVGARLTDADRKLGKNAYRAFSKAYSDAAFWVGIGTAQMQAITWCAWREANGITV